MEIVSDVKLIAPGDKVGASEATLLSKLGIKPFSYGLVIQKVSFGKPFFVHPRQVEGPGCFVKSVEESF